MTSSWNQYPQSISHYAANKNNESRRHKIVKSGYIVRNWHDYNNRLRRRGDFAIVFGISGIATEKIVGITF
jgi:hypothetical protein